MFRKGNVVKKYLSDASRRSFAAEGVKFSVHEWRRVEHAAAEVSQRSDRVGARLTVKSEFADDLSRAYRI